MNQQSVEQLSGILAIKQQLDAHDRKRDKDPFKQKASKAYEDLSVRPDFFKTGDTFFDK